MWFSSSGEREMSDHNYNSSTNDNSTTAAAAGSGGDGGGGLGLAGFLYNNNNHYIDYKTTSTIQSCSGGGGGAANYFLANRYSISFLQPPPPLGGGGGEMHVEGMSSRNSTGKAPAVSVSCGGGLSLNSVPGLNPDVELAVEWSPEEQTILDDGLAIYADEPNILKYIKISATLPDKTVRDVALRCRWMTKKETGKRRKSEEYYTGKKMKDRKEKAESSSKSSTSPAPPVIMGAYSLMMQHKDQNDRISCEGIGGTTRHLLDDNAQLFSHITANFATFKFDLKKGLWCLMIRHRRMLNTKPNMGRKGLMVIYMCSSSVEKLAVVAKPNPKIAKRNNKITFEGTCHKFGLHGLRGFECLKFPTEQILVAEGDDEV